MNISTSNNIFSDITYRSSKTFYFSSLLFPRKIKQDVFILYSFLRVTDDLVDMVNPSKELLDNYKTRTVLAIKGSTDNDPIINAFADLVRRKNIDMEYINSYFYSQDLDLNKNIYQTFGELREFMYGVSEIVGVLMAKITDLPRESYESAKLMGLGMQLVNIVRDIGEDLTRNKVYIPLEDFIHFDISFEDLKNKTLGSENKFQDLINFELNRAVKYIDEAKSGFRYIPSDVLPAIKVSAKLYGKLSEKIRKNVTSIITSKAKLNYFEIAHALMTK
jgi:phytoene synthase